jgi:hypothetical protein
VLAGLRRRAGVFDPIAHRGDELAPPAGAQYVFILAQRRKQSVMREVAHRSTFLSYRGSGGREGYAAGLAPISRLRVRAR